MIYHINEMKIQNHIIVPAYAGKKFDKIQHTPVRTLSKVGIKRMYLDIIKAVCGEAFSQHHIQ